MINCSKAPFGDKGCHFIAGFVIAIIVALLINPLVGAAIGAAFGVGKELYDKYIQKEEFDFFDMFVTITGAVIGVMGLHLFRYFTGI